MSDLLNTRVQGPSLAEHSRPGTVAPMRSEREVMTWGDLGQGARELAERIHADGFEPDVVLAIARGGLLVAGALGYALGVKNTYTMNVEFYTGLDERLPAP